MLVWSCTAITCFCIPMNVHSIASEGLTLIVASPLAFVVVPLSEPTTMIEAPGRGVPCESTIVTFTVLD